MQRFAHIPLATLLTFVLIASACSGDDPIADSDSGDPPDTSTNQDGEVVIDVDVTEVVLTSGLSGFADCDTLLDHLRSEAAARVGPYGFDEGDPYFFWGDRPIEDSADFGTDSAAGDDAAGVFAEVATPLEGVDFSGTNIQEVGVDESDIIKTDGNRIYVVAEAQLIVVDAATRQVTGALQLGSSMQTDLFLSGDDLLVISALWLDDRVTSELYSSAAEAVGDDAVESLFWREPNGVRVSRVTIDAGEPIELESLIFEGDYVSSRAIDGVARIIIRNNPRNRFPFVYPQSDVGESIAENANRATVEQSSLADWLPSLTRFDARGNMVKEPAIPDCGSVHAPTEFSGFGVLSVLNAAVGGELDAATTTSVLAPGDLVYASTESIFVATQTWFGGIALDDGGERDESAWEKAWNARQTSIHQFDLSAGGAAYAASGSVPGDIRNQFSLSEYNGHLRVISTTGDVWDETSETFVRILRPVDGNLIEVGRVGDMGNGEAVQSVRFVAEVGYVVTFREVDPFYTLDLSDPENPVLVGELKIPGFSSYLHPIGNGRVLGVGSDGDEDGRITGSKVSIFDVSDPANPTELAVWTAPGEWNEVGWEHRSFLWWEAEQLAVIPVSTYVDAEHWAGAVVLQVNDNTITEVGRIDHVEDRQLTGVTDCDKLSSDDFATTESDEVVTEAEFGSLEDGDGLLLFCGDDEAFEASGYDCYDQQWLRDEADKIGLAIPVDETLIICWSNRERVPVIGRSLVIDGDELWTLSSPWGYLSVESPARLQVNDLSSLERLDAINLS